MQMYTALSLVKRVELSTDNDPSSFIIKHTRVTSMRKHIKPAKTKHNHVTYGYQLNVHLQTLN